LCAPVFPKLCLDEGVYQVVVQAQANWTRIERIFSIEATARERFTHDVIPIEAPAYAD
jgi:hypothetical protein